ncbi:MAG: hypothetical protein U0892_01765 [Pirellulales bacterium]
MDGSDGSRDTLAGLLQILSALPQERFADVPLDGLAGTLRIRRLTVDEHSYLLVLNGASWRESVKLQIKGNSQPYYLSCIRGNHVEQTVTSTASGKQTEMVMELEPFSLAVVSCRSAEIELAAVESTPEEGALRKLEQHLLDLQSCIDRAGELTDQQVLGLIGGDFEEWGADGKPKGWTASALPNVRIERDMELPHSGRSCIRIENSGGDGSTAWIQSDRIAVPPTGRMAVEVWVRSAPGAEQPGLRLSLVGRYKDGKRFHRWHDFTQPSRHSSQIPIDWGRRPLVLLVPDVPSDELTDLNVAVDVIGPGKLWFDDVRVYGMYLHPDEKVHLLGQIFVAKEKLKAGDPGATEELLQSYWAYFLTSYLGPPNETATALTSVRSDSQRTETGKSSSKDEANISPTPSWRQSSQPRLNQWQESWRNRWQK